MEHKHDKTVFAMKEISKVKAYLNHSLESIISENEEIITEMKNAYPEITKLECANVIKNIKIIVNFLKLRNYK